MSWNRKNAEKCSLYEFSLIIVSRWITPSIFQAQNGSVIDEWTLGEMVPDAASILKTHWDTWATLADFQKISQAGFNTVRIPIGCKAAALKRSGTSCLT